MVLCFDFGVLDFTQQARGLNAIGINGASAQLRRIVSQKRIS